MGAEKQRVDVPGGHEECVLHVACGVVGREVESLEHVVVVFNLGPFGHVVSELAENIDNLLAHNAYGVTAAQFVRVSGHRKVDFRSVGRTLVGSFALELLNAGLGLLLEFVEDTSEDGFLVPVYGSELLEERRNFTFFTEEAHTCLFHFFESLALQSVKRRCNAVDILLFHNYLFFLAARFSRAFLSRAAPALRYLFHCSSLRILWTDW